MLRTQNPASGVENSLKDRLSLRVFTLRVERSTQGGLYRKGLRILIGQRVMSQHQRGFQLPAGLGIKSQLNIGVPHGLPNRSFDFGLAVEFAADFLRSPIQRRAHGEARVGLRLVVRAGLPQQVVLQKIVHRLRDGSFLLRTLLCAPRLDCLPRAGHHPKHQHHEHGGHPCHQRPVAPRKFLDLICRARRPRRQPGRLGNRCPSKYIYSF
jgi:hypothetical protein